MIFLRKTNNVKILLILVATFFATFCFSVNTATANAPVLTITAFNQKYYFYENETTVYSGKRYLNGVDGIIEKIYLDTIITPTNSIINFNPSNFDNPFTITNHIDGACIDKSLLKNQIDLALNGNINSVICKKITLKADVTKKTNLNLINLRGEFSTNYSNSTSERKHNIFLASKSINGVVLSPNQTFSFNKIVGERNEKSGYKTAKIILNGEYVDGVGGGVCQVSTTLYNAVLLAHLKVTEKHAHSLMVSYVEPSFDAMVSGNNLDLKFSNDTFSPIYITAKANGNTLTFRIYGQQNPYKIKRISLVTENVLPPPCEYEVSDTLFVGEQCVLQNEKQGVKSQGYLQYYKNDKMVNEIFIRKDYYKPITAKILIGSKERNKTDSES